MRKNNRFFALCIILSLFLTSTHNIEEVSAANNGFSTNELVDGILLENMRTCNSDTYKCADGGYEHVVYSEDRYYLNDNKFYEIDNTIHEEDFILNQKTYSYANKANKVKIYFSSSTEPGVAIVTEQGILCFDLLDLQSEKIKCGENYLFGDDKDQNLGGQNSILYHNNQSKTDVIYKAFNSGVKEYLVFNEPISQGTFHFKLRWDKALHLVVSNGRVVIVDYDNLVVFELGDLYAVDSAGNYTDKVYYHVEEQHDNEAIISITVDSEYLSREDLVYPLLIDPTVTVSGALSTYDTYVSSKWPYSNYYLNQYLRTGKDENSWARRILIKFDIPSSVDASTIQYAYLALKYQSGTTPTVRAQRVTSAWTSSTVTWNTMPSCASVQSAQMALYTGDWYRIYDTETVRNWRLGSYTNYGWLLKDETENNVDHWTTFYSSDASSYKPELHIYCTEVPVRDYVFDFRSYVDLGYQARHSSGINQVQGYQSVVASKFESVFSELAVMAWSPLSYQSAADTCKILTYGSVSQISAQVCAHSPMHLATTPLRTQLISDVGSGSNRFSKILWTGHIMMDHEGNRSNSSSSSATVIVTPYGTVNPTNYSNYSQSEIDWKSKYTLMHELSHQIGAPDHYCYNANGTSCNNPYCYKHVYGMTTLPTCIMSTYYNIEQTEATSLYCSSCVNMIRSHLQNHHYGGE